MEGFARFFLGLNALIFVALGVHGLLNPAKHMAVFDVQLYGTSILSEIRANYGGMHVGMGVLFLIGALRRDWIIAVLATLGLFLTGLAAGRVWAWVVDGTPNDAALLFLGLELIGGGLAWWLLRHQRPPAIL